MSLRSATSQITILHLLLFISSLPERDAHTGCFLFLSSLLSNSCSVEGPQSFRAPDALGTRQGEAHHFALCPTLHGGAQAETVPPGGGGSGILCFSHFVLASEVVITVFTLSEKPDVAFSVIILSSSLNSLVQLSLLL